MARSLPIFGRHRILPRQQDRDFEGFLARGARRMDDENGYVMVVPPGGVRLDIAPRNPKTGRVVLPRLVCTPPALIRWGRPQPGKTEPETQPFDSTPFWTNTSKMRCASFSLPAGPPATGGTCPASTGMPSEERRWICHKCYAFGVGQYRFAAAQIRQQLRRRWLMEVLRAEDPWVAVEAFTAALDAMLRRPMPSWDPSFLRIHDSGDFGHWVEYVWMWRQVAARFHGIHFWFPTREWVFFPDPAAAALAAPHGLGAARGNYDLAFMEEMRMLAALPNVTVRPSALQVGDAPPHIPGLSAGTAVLTEDDSKGTARCGFQSHTLHCHCPAYERGGNCEVAHCRTCWIKPDVSVDYPSH